MTQPSPHLTMKLNPKTLEIIIKLYKLEKTPNEILEWLVFKCEALDGATPLRLINAGQSNLVMDYIKAIERLEV